MHDCETKVCNHKEVKYCNKCQKVHCKCGKVWGEKEYVYPQYDSNTVPVFFSPPIPYCGTTTAPRVSTWDNSGTWGISTTDLPQNY